MQVKISNIVHYVASLFRGFAGVVAGVDDAGLVRAVKTTADGKLVLAADVDLEGEPIEEIVRQENVDVLAGNTTPLTEFPIYDPATPMPAIRQFSVSASIHTAGKGKVYIEYRTSGTAAWREAKTVNVEFGKKPVDKLYVPSRMRYKVYYKATNATQGLDLVVLTFPMF